MPTKRRTKQPKTGLPERDCVQCGGIMRPGECNGQRAWYCGGCGGVVYSDPAKVSVPKLPHLDPGIQEKTYVEAEKALCRRIKLELGHHGYIVWLVGQGDAKRGGNDEGTPDVFYTREEWQGAFYAFEVKLPGYTDADVRELQKHFVKIGVYPIVTSPQEAVERAKQIQIKRAA